MVAAVSDGHGARAHFRSGDGARFAVETAVDDLAWHLDDRDAEAVADGMAGRLATAWRGLVYQHLSARPYDGVERVLAGSPFSPYGATLLTLGADADALVMLQIGDGDLMLGYPDGRLERPLPADEGLIGEQTYSLCSEDAATHCRVASIWRPVGAEWPDFALLGSDGVSKSFSDDHAFDDAVARLRMLALTDWDALMAALPDWLRDLAERGSGDDSSLCLLARTSQGITR